MKVTLVLSQNLLPYFYNCIPSTGHDHTWFNRRPNTTNRWTFIMCLEPPCIFTCFPIPNKELTIAITTSDKFTIWRKCNVACVASNRMTRKPFLSLLSKPIARLINHYLIVKRLSSPETVAGMLRNHRHRVHSRFRYIFNRYTNVPLPHQHFFVIRRCYHFRSILAKCDGIHRCKVMIIFLSDFSCSRIKCYYFVIRHSRHEKVIIFWIKFNNIGYSTI
mmetsp:Transcript_12941/g.16905  ORF Transcript_12941/g.16905 Transcript_12941/m.16905 type:complete len:219 (-) Transcript_12941:1379-2035(-)